MALVTRTSGDISFTALGATNTPAADGAITFVGGGGISLDADLLGGLSINNTGAFLDGGAGGSLTLDAGAEEATLDVPLTTITGDVVILGTLTANLNITPSFPDPILTIYDTLTSDDAGADGGGYRLKGTTNKHLFWYQAANAWTSNVNFDLSSSSSTYKIDGNTVISATALGEGIAIDGGIY
jgi:hypothetical protein